MAVVCSPPVGPLWPGDAEPEGISPDSGLGPLTAHTGANSVIRSLVSIFTFHIIDQRCTVLQSCFENIHFFTMRLTRMIFNFTVVGR